MGTEQNRTEWIENRCGMDTEQNDTERIKNGNVCGLAIDCILSSIPVRFLQIATVDNRRVTVNEWYT